MNDPMIGTNEVPHKDACGPESGCCGRQKATDVLRQKAKMLRRKANGLQQLADQLDLIEKEAGRGNGESGLRIGVGSGAEAILWDMACQYEAR